MDDQKIIDLFFLRSEQAIGAVSARYGSYCRAIAGNILNNDCDAEECINDTYLRLWNTIPPEKPANLKLYIAKILRNAALDRYRANSAQKRSSGMDEVLDELSEVLPGGDNPEEAYLAKELADAMRSFVSLLPRRESDLFIRRYFFAESIQSIARRYGLTAHNVSVILSRVRQKLREHLILEDYIHE